MSEKDKLKLQSAYNCKGQDYSGCGGSLTGEEGQLEGSFDDGCEWLITVEDGYAVEVDFQEFKVIIILINYEYSIQ